MAFRRLAPLILAALVCIRFATLGKPDLTDPSESRFANSARHMIESGDWTTPRIITLQNGWEPYLAKPPLHIWLTALSFRMFGTTPWAARAVAAAATCMTAAWIMLFCFVFFPAHALEAALIFFSLPAVFFLCCASTTDPLLMMSVTGAIVCALVSPEYRWAGYLHFFLLAAGFLTKGPVAFVLTWGPLAVWYGKSRSAGSARDLPFAWGAFIFLICAGPWYAAAEMRNPGFLHYFFVQENIGRYLTKNFGNRFGSTHTKIYGMSFAYLGAVLLPLSAAVFGAVSRAARIRMRALIDSEPMLPLLIAWLLIPALFFAFARQILPTYLYPSIPAASILAAVFMHGRPAAMRWITCSLVLVSAVALSAALFSKEVSSKISAAGLAPFLAAASGASPPEKCGAFLFYDKLPQSLYFAGRDVLGSFAEASALDIRSYPPESCVIGSAKRVSEMNSVFPVRVLASSGGWELVKAQVSRT